MTAPEPRDFNRFAIVPIYSDSSGREAVPQNALFVGSQKVVMERILDSEARREALTLVNDADKVRKEKAALRADKAEFEADVAEFEADKEAYTCAILQDFINKLDDISARMDSLEAERAHDPDDDILTLPPGMHDEGDLESPTKPRNPELLDPDFDDEPDLPRSPVAMEDT